MLDAQTHHSWLNSNRLGWCAALAGLLLVCAGQRPAIAQTEDAFPPNPLEITEPDPLLPTMVVDRPLSPQERSVLAAAVDELDRQAETQLAAGDLPGAFELWYRVLRLRRVLGTEQEVASLRRVGEIAWRENQTTEVRLITQRLQQIEQEALAQPTIDFDLLLQIAQAYGSMRAIDPAITAYGRILAQARQQQDTAREIEALQAMGSLQLAWFDYAGAASVYQELYALALAQNDAAAQEEYLKQLAYIYQQGNQPEQAIAAQEQLVEVYVQRQEYLQIPALKVAIGDAYRTLNRLDAAATSYQEAFAVSRSTQQFAYASDALQRLAALYQTINRPEDALVVYQLRLDVEQQSYNTFGQMETYDQIGQLQRQQGNTAAAIAAFQRGLALARQLNYRVSYFTTQIEEIRAQ